MPVACLTTGEAMDLVAAQCERRGLTDASTWLCAMSLHALPSLLSTPLPLSAALSQALPYLDAEVIDGASPTSSSGLAGTAHAQRAAMRRLHRLALGYLKKGEFLRCHHLLLGEVMAHEVHRASVEETEQQTSRAVKEASAGVHEAEEEEGSTQLPGLPAPAVVRGFRTTTLPPALQFICLYALLMEGIKSKQLNNNSCSSSGYGAGGGGGGGGLGVGGPQRAVHPHARVLRAYLLEAMRNPLNVLRSPSEKQQPSQRKEEEEFEEEEAVAVHSQISAAAVGSREALQTPSAKRPSWTTTTTTGSTVRRAGQVGTVLDAAPSGGVNAAPSTASRSTIGSHAFSNASPAACVTPYTSTPAARPPTSGDDDATSRRGTHPTTTATAAALLEMDPYLLWLMGVVLRELRMRQESATFLLAAVSVNALLRCAWEDLVSLVSREAQLVELETAVDGVEPFFMVDVFAAEVRGLLGVTPVSSGRLRLAAASGMSMGSAANGGGVDSSKEGMPLSVRAATAATTTTSTPDSAAFRERVTSPQGEYVANNGSPASPTTGTPTNAWECLAVLFPETPYVLSQLARFYYHQRNRLDKAESLYQKIRAIDPYNYAILYDYSNVLYTKRDRLGLSSLAQSVYQADPFRAETNFAVGNYCVLLGQHDRAALHFRRTTAINPLCAEAWLLLGHAYVEVKNTTAAVEAYRTAVELNERDYRGWYNLGQIYELLEAYHHALYYYWHTTTLRPADPGMWVAVANCLEQDGRVAESVACLERAESYDTNRSPNYPTYVRRIATHHIANSSFTRACVYLEKLTQSPAATSEDLLLALPFLIQHYLQRARKSMEVSARSPSYDPTLFAPGLPHSPSGTDRTALHHARAAAAVQHLHRAEEHLETMSALVLQDEAAESGNMNALSLDGHRASLNVNMEESGQQLCQRQQQTTPSSSSDLPSVAFVRSRRQEVAALQAQAMAYLHPPIITGSVTNAAGTQGTAVSSRNSFSARVLGRYP